MADGSVLFAVVALRKESVDRNLRWLTLARPFWASLSARRAWIEILAHHRDAPRKWSLSARRAWIEISASGLPAPVSESLSARRAWIEIFWYSSRIIMLVVALRKESVDRNHVTVLPAAGVAVALRKESVDRNMRQVVHIHAEVPSLSARRAWIEITSQVPTWFGIPVALRKESVDRNLRPLKCCLHLGGRSPQGERG